MSPSSNDSVARSVDVGAVAGRNSVNWDANGDGVLDRIDLVLHREEVDVAGSTDTRLPGQIRYYEGDGAGVLTMKGTCDTAALRGTAALRHCDTERHMF
jgi:hypothetical protein